MLIAMLGNALRSSLSSWGHPDPLTVSAYYLSASGEGPVTIETELVRTGRTMSTATASLRQLDPEGAPVERIRALATYGDLGTLTEDVHITVPRPELPPPDECLSIDQAPNPFKDNAPFLSRLDMRYDPSTSGWTQGKPSGDAMIQAWLRMPDGREPDPFLLLMAVDALPPVTFELGHFGWVPTLELTAHVRAKPAPGWLVVRHRSRNYAGGMLEEDAEVWDSTGRLVAQSRQLARAPRRREKRQT